MRKRREHDEHLLVDRHAGEDLGDESDEEAKHGHSAVDLLRIRGKALRAPVLALQLRGSVLLLAPECRVRLLGSLQLHPRGGPCGRSGRGRGRLSGEGACAQRGEG